MAEHRFRRPLNIRTVERYVLASMETPSAHWCEDWRIVGREDELSALRRAIDAARAGRGSIVTVEGPRGSGRTRLVREAAVVARGAGLRVVFLRGRPDIASSLMAAALDDATRGRPVLIVDDEEIPLEFPSVRIDPSGLPVLVLVTRTERSIDVDPASDAPELAPRGTRVRLAPLRPGAVMALAAHMGTAASIPTLERLHAATEGNALLVVETLRALGRSHGVAESEPWPLSERAMAWVGTRLGALSPAHRHALEAASILGGECDVVLVARLLDEPADPSQVGRDLEATTFVALRSAGRRCRFVPPLGCDLVYASLAPERRATLHTRAALALASGGTTSRAMLAHHALAASAAGDVRRCAYYVGRLVGDPAGPDAAADPTWPYFVREGEHWAIGFGDRAIRLHDRTGFHYLAHLLSRPGVEFAALGFGKPLSARNGSDGASSEPPLAGERARVRVTRRIRDGIDRIARVHPELGAHLERTIRTGARCIYVVDPETAPRWKIRWSA